jgi:hypothetical protein
MTHRIIVSAVMQLFLLNYLNAQDSQSRWSIYASGGIMQGKIKNINMENDATLFRTQKSSIPVQFGFSYRMGKGSYLVSGLRISDYNTDYISHGRYIGAYKTDIDGYAYRPVIITDYTIKSRLTLASVPVIIRFTSPQSAVHFSFDLGLLAGFGGGNVFDSDGSYEKQGLYPTTNGGNINVLYSNMPEYGYLSFGAFKYNVKTKAVIMSVFSSIGYIADITPGVHIYSNLFYSRSLGDIVQKDVRAKGYQNALEKNDSYEKSLITGYGFETGFSFDIVKKH